MKVQPIKRNEALKALSREHHYGLLLCWKIRTGFKKAVSVERIKAYTSWFYEKNLQPHFSIEEEAIFPILGNENLLVKRALADHRKLKRLLDNEIELEKSLNLFEEELEKHIRFEERILFDEIQKVASTNQLKLIAKVHSQQCIHEEWDDEFWK